MCDSLQPHGLQPCQASLSMGFPRLEHCSGLPFPPLGDLPNPGIEPMSLTSPPGAGHLFTSGATWEGQVRENGYTYMYMYG